MPKAHRAHSQWTPSRIIDWARKSGEHTAALVEKIMVEKKHPEQGFRASLGIIRLGERYGKDRLNQACGRALRYGAHRYRYVKSILERQLDIADLDQSPPSNPITHENIRGGNYYDNKEEELENVNQ